MATQRGSHLTNVYSEEVLKTSSQVYQVKEKFGIFFITAYIISVDPRRGALIEL